MVPLDPRDPWGLKAHKGFPARTAWRDPSALRDQPAPTETTDASALKASRARLDLKDLRDLRVQRVSREIPVGLPVQKDLLGQRDLPDPKVNSDPLVPLGLTAQLDLSVLKARKVCRVSLDR